MSNDNMGSKMTHFNKKKTHFKLNLVPKLRLAYWLIYYDKPKYEPIKQLRQTSSK